MDHLLLIAPARANRPPLRRARTPRPLLGVVAWCAAAAVLAQGEQALLQCDVTYAGSTHTLQAHPVLDPYPVPRTDIAGRFAFKPVLVGNGRRVDYVALYAYVDSPRGPLLVQQAKYLPPFALPPSGSTAPLDLTGQQSLYAGPVERELQYRCTLQGHQP